MFVRADVQGGLGKVKAEGYRDDVAAALGRRFAAARVRRSRPQRCARTRAGHAAVWNRGALRRRRFAHRARRGDRPGARPQLGARGRVRHAPGPGPTPRQRHPGGHHAARLHRRAGDRFGNARAGCGPEGRYPHHYRAGRPAHGLRLRGDGRVQSRPRFHRARELLDGTADVRVTIQGSLDSMDVRGEAKAAEVHWNAFQMPGAGAKLAWQGGARPRVELEASADSVTRRQVRRARPCLLATGDSPTRCAGVSAPRAVAVRRPGPRRIPVASRDGRSSSIPSVSSSAATAGRVRHRSRCTLADSTWSFSETAVSRKDGSARIAVVGDMPSKREGEFDVRVAGLDLRDIYASCSATHPG